MSPSIITTRNRLSPATGTGARQSPLGWIGSILLHGLILGATLFTFTHKLEITDETPPVVPVDLVTIGEKTNIRAMAPPKPHIAPKPAPEPVIPKELVPPTPTPQQKSELAPPPPLEKAPEPIPRKPQPQPEVKPQPKPKPPKAKPKDEEDKVSALLNKLTAPSAAPAHAKPSTRTVQGVGQMNAMVADLQDALRSQIEQCWSPPIGAPHASDLVVDFDLVLNRDGSVSATQPPQLTASSQAAAASNPYTRAAAEAARRAIYECAPYKLPQDRYSQWREINPFHFDPRQMMGQ